MYPTTKENFKNTYSLYYMGLMNQTAYCCSPPYLPKCKATKDHILNCIKKIGTQWVHESTLHIFCKRCTFLRYSRVAVSSRKLLGVVELLYFETELLMSVMNGLH